jgi:hypothetical protein
VIEKSEAVDASVAFTREEAIMDDDILPLFVGILIHDHNTINYNYGTTLLWTTWTEFGRI